MATEKWLFFFFSICGRIRWADETVEHPAPLARHPGAAEFAEPGNELVPGHHGQARRVLEDRHQSALVADGQNGDRPILGVSSQSPRPGQHAAKAFFGKVVLGSESFDETLNRVP